MGPVAFECDGRWLRGNLHARSGRSDAAAPPEHVIAEFREAGYDFLVLTDHFEARWGWVRHRHNQRDNPTRVSSSARPLAEPMSRRHATAYGGRVGFVETIRAVGLVAGTRATRAATATCAVGDGQVEGAEPPRGAMLLPACCAPR